MNSILLAGLCSARIAGNVHPPNQIRSPAELRANSNSAFRLGSKVAHCRRDLDSTSTSKLYFLTRFSVIFADSFRYGSGECSGARRDSLPSEPNRKSTVKPMFVAGYAEDPR